MTSQSIQSVPNGVGKFLDEVGYEKFGIDELLNKFSENQAIVQSYLDFLETKNLIVEVADTVLLQPLVVNPPHQKCISNVWIDYADDVYQSRRAILKLLREKFKSINIILVLEESTEENLENLRLSFVQDGWHNIGIYIKGEIQVALRENKFDKVLCGSKRTANALRDEGGEYFAKASVKVHDQSALFSSLQDFTKIKYGRENSQNIYISKENEIFPHPFDRSYLIGKFENVSEFTDAITGSAYLTYSNFSKDRIEKCSACEYAIACGNPLWFREIPDDLSSSPTNCLYEPELGEWGREV